MTPPGTDSCFLVACLRGLDLLEGSATAFLGIVSSFFFAAVLALAAAGLAAFFLVALSCAGDFLIGALFLREDFRVAAVFAGALELERADSRLPRPRDVLGDSSFSASVSSSGPGAMSPSRVISGIGFPKSAVMLERSLLSSPVASVKAEPSRPARAVRPMRWI